MVKADGNFFFCLFSHDGELSEGVPGRVRHRPGQDAADAPHPPRTRTQLLRLLLRDHQLARPGVPLGQTGWEGTRELLHTVETGYEVEIHLRGK